MSFVHNPIVSWVHATKIFVARTFQERTEDTKKIALTGHRLGKGINSAGMNPEFVWSAKDMHWDIIH